MESKRISLKVWIEKYFDNKLDPSVRDLLKLNERDAINFDDEGYVNRDLERLPPGRVGEVVELCTAYLINGYKKTLFKKILGGYLKLKQDLRDQPLDFWKDKRYRREEYQDMVNFEERDIEDLKFNLEHLGLTYRSIYLFCKLIKYMEIVRGHGYEKFYRVKLPDDQTIENIKKMAIRSAEFLKKYDRAEHQCPYISDGVSKVVNSDGFDFNSVGVFFDMKVKNVVGLSDVDILQQFVIHVLARRRRYEFEKCVVFNPRYGTYFEIDLNKIPQEVIDHIENNI